MMIQPAIWAVILGRLASLLPTVLILIGAVIYLARTKTAAGVLLVIGTVVWLGAGLGAVALTAVMVSGQQSNQSMGLCSTVLQAIHLLGGLVFAAGFLRLAFQAAPASPAGRAMAARSN